MTPPVPLLVRRSRIVAGMNAALALAVVLAALGYVVTHASEAEAPWMGAAMVAALIAFQAWRNLQYLTDRTPVVVIGPEGLALPLNADAPIPWTAISRLGAARGAARIGGGRLDFEVDPETFARIRLGKRMMGDPVVKMPALPYGISIVAQSLDHPAGAMQAAIEAFWPPRD